MKKIVALLMGLVCVFTMTACGGEQKQPEPAYHQSVVAELVEAGAFSEELEELDADTAFMLYKLADYGVEREELGDAWVLRSAGATCEEVALLAMAAEDTELLGHVEQALKDYVQSQIEANVDYRPNEIPKLESAMVKRSGGTVLLVVANDLDAAESVLN